MSELIDNRAQRISTLKEIIKHLHRGEEPELVKDQLVQIVRQTDATEIMCMEQDLINEGMKVEEVRSMCDLHSQVTRDVLVSLPASVPPGHPVDTFRRENAAVREVIGSMQAALAEAAMLDAAADAKQLLYRVRQAANDLMDIDKHYQRKEHALFSCLERHGITGPSKVMWAKDDEVREALKRLNKATHECGPTAGEVSGISRIALPACAAVEEMMYKEENILLPMSLKTFTENEWGEIWAASPKYGWCLVEPQQGYAPPAGIEVDATAGVPNDGTIMMPTGHVTVEQLTAVLSTLPLDITFVDADDRVAFFTEGPDRIFARSKAIVGRKVQHCHPPRSVETVDRILDDFRTGRQNVAEFWIDFHGKFVHIRYFAVRNKAGEYLGTLELTQDIAPLKKIEGERRLLEYDTRASA